VADQVSEPVLLTPKQAAQLLHVSVPTLFALPVPYVTIGKGRKRPHRRYLRESLEKWAKSREAA